MQTLYRLMIYMTSGNNHTLLYKSEQMARANLDKLMPKRLGSIQEQFDKDAGAHIEDEYGQSANIRLDGIDTVLLSDLQKEFDGMADVTRLQQRFQNAMAADPRNALVVPPHKQN